MAQSEPDRQVQLAAAGLCRPPPAGLRRRAGGPGGGWHLAGGHARWPDSLEAQLLLQVFPLLCELHRHARLNVLGILPPLRLWLYYDWPALLVSAQRTTHLQKKRRGCQKSRRREMSKGWVREMQGEGARSE